MASVSEWGHTYELTIDPKSGDGELVSRPPSSHPGPPALAEVRLEAKVPSREQLTDAARASFDKLGIAGGVSLARVPHLRFALQGNAGERYAATFDLRKKTLTLRSEGDALRILSPRAFLLQLHEQNIYPRAMSVRWVWALVVDLMAACMVFWGVSGVIMWWQLKGLRRPGGLVLAASLTTATLVAIAIYRAFTS